MAVAEPARLFLYLVEWLFTVSILGTFPAQLIIRGQPLARASGGLGDVCLLSQTVGLSRCRFGVAWAAIAFGVLTIAVAWHLLDYCTRRSLPYNVETVIFGWLAAWWFVGGAVFWAQRAGNAPGAATAVVVLAWLLCVMSVVSCMLAAKGGTKGMRSSATGVSSDELEEDTYV